MRSRGTRRLGMDMMTQLFLATVVVLYIVMAYINIPEDKVNEDPRQQGNLIIQLMWADETDCDIDLWVRGEADNVAVGYSNKSGPLFNLLRDDLGTLADLSGKNEEETISRGIPDGEYVINAHLFNLKNAKLPVAVRVVVFLKPSPEASAKQIFAVSGELKRNGEEKTLARFVIKDKKFVVESMSTVHTPLRAYIGGGQ